VHALPFIFRLTDSHYTGGVLTFQSYERDFRYTDDEATSVAALAVGLQQLGALLGCFLIWPVTHWIGRKYSIVICSAIFILGAAVQTINSHNTSVFFAGRIVAGLGLGGSSVVVPMYSSEMAPKQIRGQIGSFYQLMFVSFARIMS
jgi:MFS family permease